MQQLLGRLTFARKLAVVLAFSLVTVAVLALMYAQGVRSQWVQARTERLGLVPAGVLLDLVRHTQKHRGLSQLVLDGNAEALNQLVAVYKRLDEAWGSVSQELQSRGLDTLAAKAVELRAGTKKLTDAVSAQSLDGEQSRVAHDRLVEGELALLHAAVAASHITLHPEPAGNALQEAVYRRLTRLSESLGRVRDLGAGLLSNGMPEPAIQQRLGFLLEQSSQQMDEALQALELAMTADPGLRDTLAPLAAGMKTQVDEGVALATEQLVETESFRLSASEWWERSTRTIDSQFKLADASQEALQAHLLGFEQQLQQRIVAVAALLGLFVVLVTLLVRAIARQSVDSMKRVVAVAEAVAAGDLTRQAQVQGTDEGAQMLRALMKMSDELARLVTDVRRNAVLVASESAEIAQGNQDLSHRTELQAGSLQQTASSMEQLSATVAQNSDSASQANDLAQRASEVAQRGGAAVTEVVDSMQLISDSATRINDIIATIDGIAFQTNILALNAAVESARAGEQGRGFAVVAGEVRALAQRSATAAGEIRTLITASAERVAQGTAQAEQAGRTMQEIVDATRRVSDIMREISSASVEQAANLEQVKDSVDQLDEATQRNAALVEQSAAATQSLQQRAQALQQAVRTFRVSTADAQEEEAPAAAVGQASTRPDSGITESPSGPRRVSSADMPVAAG